MKDRLHYYWHFVSHSLWFVPLLMCIGGVIVAIGLLTYGDVKIENQNQGSYWLLYTGDPENARELMAALLAGMITMTSLVVSITMVVLTLAAGQIGPRLIRSFIQDRTTQIVLGLFLADTFYLLVVFRTIDEGSDTVPHLAVSMGTFVTAICLLVLLFFIHNLARSIIYDTVVRNVAAEVREVVGERLPEPVGDPEQEPGLEPDPARIDAGKDGYIQTVDYERIIHAAKREKAVIRLEFRPGDFVLRRGGHVSVHPAEACTADLCEDVRSALVIGSERTPTQDVGYGIRQMVEIATRALSPGLNDVFTALAVIDNLTPVLVDILSRDPEPRVLKDGEGLVRVVRPTVTHAEMIGTAFDQIRHSGSGTPAILQRLADTIGRLSRFVRTEEQRAALRDQVDTVEAAAKKRLDLPRDLGMVLDACRAARTGLADTLAKGASVDRGRRASLS